MFSHIIPHIYIYFSAGIRSNGPMSQVSDSGEGLISGVLHIDPLCGLNPSEASWLKVLTGGKKKKKRLKVTLKQKMEKKNKLQGEEREEGGRE